MICILLGAAEAGDLRYVFDYGKNAVASYS